MTVFAPEFRGPYFVERGVTQDLELRVQVDGKYRVPVSGTMTLRSAADEVVVSGSVHAEDRAVKFTVSGSDLPSSYSLGDMWQVEWDLEFSLPEGNRSHVFRNEAGLVRRRPYPVVTTEDLYRRHGELRKLQARMTNSPQGHIDDAWDEIVAKLVSDERWPHKIMTPWALRPPHISLALYRIYNDLDSQSTGDGGRWAELADNYHTEWMDGWDQLQFRYDEGDEGDPSSGDDKVAGEPVIFLF